MSTIRYNSFLGCITFSWPEVTKVIGMNSQSNFMTYDLHLSSLYTLYNADYNLYNTSYVFSIYFSFLVASFFGRTLLINVPYNLFLAKYL